MIYVDVTKTAAAGHRSGLMRVTSRLLAELGAAATPLAWPFTTRKFTAGDTVLTAELFSEAERPGLTEFLATRTCRAVAIFHDAIPLKYPHITWPQSVSRHPEYMKLLARFDRLWAVSAASRDELLGFWQWQGVERAPAVDVLPLGADFNGAPRAAAPHPANRPTPPVLFCLGIIEPRKNQGFLLDVCADLWDAGVDFELHIAGRVNPHFGGPLRRRIQETARRYRGLHYHPAASDAQVAELFGRARATVLPTIAEGCGLPLLESLWLGVPCVCSDLPVLRENADAGGCVKVPVNDRAAWKQALQRVLTDDAFQASLVQQAASRPLTTWRDTAEIVRRASA